MWREGMTYSEFLERGGLVGEPDETSWWISTVIVSGQPRLVRKDDPERHRAPQARRGEW